MKKIILLLAICAIYTQAQSQSWNLTGNAGTNGSTNFIGTTDNVPFKIRTKNVVRVTVNGSGKVGIGISSPVFKLDVKGGSINTDSVYRIGGNTVLSVKGNGNTFTGINSGLVNTLGSYNTAIGVAALSSLISGYGNTACGYYALSANTYGNWNTATGYQALLSNTTGTYNSAYGYQSLFSSTTGIYNTAIGCSTLYANNTGNRNTAIGKDALHFNTNGYENTANGCSALYENTAGYHNIAIGCYALLENTTGNENTACGSATLIQNSIGTQNTANGGSALSHNTTGSYNTANGTNALSYNITGNNNSALGYSASFDSTNLNNTTCMGSHSGGVVNSSNRIELGNTSVSVIAGQVGFSTYSDARIKDNVQEDVPGLAFISKLRPVTYHLNIHRENEMVYKGTKKDDADWAEKYDIEKIKMTGFLAQDVEKAAKETGYDFSGVQKPANPDELYSLRYSDFVMPLVKAVQELSAKNNAQDMIIENLKAEINNLKSNSKQSEINNPKSGILFQNSPNPFNSETEIKFQLPAKFNSGMLVISDESGKQIRTYNVQSSTSVILKAEELSAGTYSYLLIIDGSTVDSKQMVLTTK